MTIRHVGLTGSSMCPGKVVLKKLYGVERVILVRLNVHSVELCLKECFGTEEDSVFIYYPILWVKILLIQTDKKVSRLIVF